MHVDDLGDFHFDYIDAGEVVLSLAGVAVGGDTLRSPLLPTIKMFFSTAAEFTDTHPVIHAIVVVIVAAI